MPSGSKKRAKQKAAKSSSNKGTGDLPSPKSQEGTAPKDEEPSPLSASSSTDSQLAEAPTTNGVAEGEGVSSEQAEQGLTDQRDHGGLVPRYPPLQAAEQPGVSGTGSHWRSSHLTGHRLHMGQHGGVHEQQASAPGVQGRWDQGHSATPGIQERFDHGYSPAATPHDWDKLSEGSGSVAMDDLLDDALDMWTPTAIYGQSQPHDSSAVGGAADTPKEQLKEKHLEPIVEKEPSQPEPSITKPPSPPAAEPPAPSTPEAEKESAAVPTATAATQANSSASHPTDTKQVLEVNEAEEAPVSSSQDDVPAGSSSTATEAADKNQLRLVAAEPEAVTCSGLMCWLFFPKAAKSAAAPPRQRS